MPTVSEINDYIFGFAPKKYALADDNVGLLFGFADKNVTKAMVALDITADVVRECFALGGLAIVSHHPVFFSVKNIVDHTPTGEIIMRLGEYGISAICMHTNVDAAPGGINDVLAEKLGLLKPYVSFGENGEALTDSAGAPYGFSRIGRLSDPCSLPVFAEHIQKVLGTRGLRYYDAGIDASRVAVSSGAGSSMLDICVRNGCDTFITGDIKYHQFVYARQLGINLVDAGHFGTENIIVEVLAEKLRAGFPGLEVVTSKAHRDYTEII